MVTGAAPFFSENWGSSKLGQTFEFIAISEARDIYMEEHDSWTYYVPPDRVDSEWDLFYVLMIETKETGI